MTEVDPDYFSWDRDMGTAVRCGVDLDEETLHGAWR